MYRTPHINEQHKWGGATYHPDSPSPSLTSNFSQHTFVGQHGHDSYQHAVADDLFNPAIGGPSTRTFNLPNVPFSTNPHFNRPSPDTFQRVHNFHHDTPPHLLAQSLNNSIPTHPPPIPPHPPRAVPLFPIPPFNPLSIQFPPQPSSLPPPFVAPNSSQHPVRYVYCLPPPLPLSSVIPSLNASSKALLSVTHISLLNSKSDFYTWDEGVTALLRHLGGMPRGLLPSSNMTNRTAYAIYSTLAHYYGLRGWADVHEYVSKWHTGVSRLWSAQFPLSMKLLISNFTCGLPLSAAFNTLLSSHITLAGDQDVGAFIALTETALDLEATFWAAVQAQPSCPTRSLPPVATSAVASLPAPTPSTKSVASPLPHLLCQVMSIPICTVPTVAVLVTNKGQTLAMLAAMIEDAFLSCDTPPSPPDPISPMDPLDTLDDAPVIPLAHLSVAPFVALNPTLHCDVYILREPPKCPLVFVSHSIADFTSVAFLSLGGHFNSALDSGCIDHIIRDHALFWHYDTSKAVAIGTANSGSLAALGGGDVSFRIPFPDGTGQAQYILFTLCNCLHAPDAPINLISIGAIVHQY
ncbi:hypothetical protein BYT27DRAFT_7259129 [Phlegmacium glaucopus]|nr:hypothetical protein BYT27DRAFT_7259129 [Phlegmacium glaucopus]